MWSGRVYRRGGSKRSSTGTISTRVSGTGARGGGGILGGSPRNPRISIPLRTWQYYILERTHNVTHTHTHAILMVNFPANPRYLRVPILFPDCSEKETLGFIGACSSSGSIQSTVSKHWKDQQITTDRTDKKAQHNQCTVFNKARFFLTDFWSHLILCLGGQSQHRGHGSHLFLVEIDHCHETCPTDLHISQALNTASSSDDDKITFYHYAYIQEYNKRINKWSKKFDKRPHRHYTWFNGICQVAPKSIVSAFLHSSWQWSLGITVCVQVNC